MRIALEVGTHSPWLSRLLEELGHEVLVANPVQLRLIYKNHRKTDKVDAEYLARLARLDPRLLAPIRHRGVRAQQDLAVVRSRDALVRVRTLLVNHVRCTTKSTGHRLPACGTHSFADKVSSEIPKSLRKALNPLVQMLGSITRKIRAYDKELEKLCQTHYPETQLLRQVFGVGPVTALTFVLTLEDPRRFTRSRAVGAYLGLVPRKRESGAHSPQLRISKRGDAHLRRLLVGCAQYILGPFGKDCDLRRQGLRIAERGGKQAKRRAVVAVARKLAVLLHHLWSTAQVYEPFHNEQQRPKVA